MTTFKTLAVYLTKLFTANKIYLHRARSGFEPEMPATKWHARFRYEKYARFYMENLKGREYFGNRV
jgi:hypothetical protein